MMLKLFLLLVSVFLTTPVFSKTGCGTSSVWLQVLGSGGPELDDNRASSGYLIWRDGKATLLIDAGSGSLFRFEQSGASLNELDAILLTHLHVDHSNDLPSLVKASYFSGRQRDLKLYGPDGNHLMPSMTKFVEDLFGPDGAFKYLSSYLDGSDDYRLLAHNISASGKTPMVVENNSRFKLTAVPVHHGPVPALAWRVDMDSKSIVFSGDMNNDNATLAGLSGQADILVAHHAIPEGAHGAARNLHMPPSVIGQIAATAKVKELVLSHRMKRTLGREKESTDKIRQHYSGPVVFADDLQCIEL